MRVAIIHESSPWPTISGANTRIASLITHLDKRGIEVTLIAASTKQHQLTNYIPCQLSRIETFKAPGTLNKLRRLKGKFDQTLEALRLPTLDEILLFIFKNGLSPTTTNNWKRYPEGLDRFVLQAHNKYRFDAIFVEYIWMHKSVSLLKGSVPVALDMHDLMHQRSAEFLRMGFVDPFNITEDQELSILDTFDAVLAIQETEADAIEGKLRHSVLLRTGVDSFDPLPMPAPGALVEILYVGGDNACNVDGIYWFLKNIWPTIHNRHPRARLLIAGRVCKSIKASNRNAGNGVETIGFTDAATLLYAKASVCINPLNFGSGLKIKTIEALGKGRPLVTSRVGIEGIRPTPKDACIVADEAAAWIQALDELCSDREKRQEYADRAKNYASKWLTPDRVYKEVTAWLSSLEQPTHMKCSLR